jgi:hypothetical protein
MSKPDTDSAVEHTNSSDSGRARERLRAELAINLDLALEYEYQPNELKREQALTAVLKRQFVKNMKFIKSFLKMERRED